MLDQKQIKEDATEAFRESGCLNLGLLHAVGLDYDARKGVVIEKPTFAEIADGLEKVMSVCNGKKAGK